MHIQTRLDPEILKAAKKAAKLEGTSLSEYLRALVIRNLEAPGGEFRGGKRQSRNEGDSDQIR